jgi:hypothetical protein
LSFLIYLKNKLKSRTYSLFRENYGCHQLIRTTLTADGERCSLSESRHSIGSAKQQTQSQQQNRRSSEYHRAHNPRVLTPTLPAPRHSNYRSPTSVYARASKRIVQHQNSQASLLYGYQQPHH